MENGTRNRIKTLGDAAAAGYRLCSMTLVSSSGHRAGSYYWFEGDYGFSTESRPRGTKGEALKVLRELLGTGKPVEATFGIYTPGEGRSVKTLRAASQKALTARVNRWLETLDDDVQIDWPADYVPVEA